MAILKSYNLSLEINFMEFDFAGWVQYEVVFKIDGQNIINPKSLKTVNFHWKDRPNNGFKVNEHEYDTLIPTLEEVLETNEPDYWQPLEPDITLGIYPDIHFPFLPSHGTIIHESHEFKEKRLQREKLKKEQKKLSDDPIQFLCLVDTYNFTETSAYSGDGVALHITAKRTQAEKFLTDLKNEYAVFQVKFKVEIDKYFEKYG